MMTKHLLWIWTEKTLISPNMLNTTPPTTFVVPILGEGVLQWFMENQQVDSIVVLLVIHATPGTETAFVRLGGIEHLTSESHLGPL